MNIEIPHWIFMKDQRAINALEHYTLGNAWMTVADQNILNGLVYAGFEFRLSIERILDELALISFQFDKELIDKLKNKDYAAKKLKSLAIDEEFKLIEKILP